MSLRQSVAVHPPSHFLTLRPGAAGATDKAFTEGITKFFKALRRRCLARHLEFLVVSEWRRRVRHGHALIRVDGSMPFKVLKRAVREAKVLAGLRCSVKPVRNVIGVANYVFKHTRRPELRAELTPEGFKGRMFTVSKGFLTMPFKELWRVFRGANCNSTMTTITRRSEVTGVNTVTLHFDGACEPNPDGLATFGAVLDGPGISARVSGMAAEGPGATNNVAEWRGLEAGLEHLAAHKPPGVTALVIRGDSQLVLKQLTGEWGCHKPHLAAARDRCLTLLSALGLEWSAQWVPRDQNAEADELTVKAWVAAAGRPFPEKPAWHRKRR